MLLGCGVPVAVGAAVQPTQERGERQQQQQQQVVKAEPGVDEGVVGVQ
jgi:hypothetical protein